ncbi:MAG: ankyrin repeat domain-containing protein, partial [Bacteroidetes bacterium]|nr:ankyrin repeat domain-containing protein [Bacteroidota bacterium]
MNLFKTPYYLIPSLLSLVFILSSFISFSQESFHDLVNNGEKEKVIALLNEGVDVDLRDEDSLTALMFACVNADYELADLLIKKGAEINTIDGEGNEVIFYAIDSEDIDVVSLIISNGANVNSINAGG